MITAATRSRWMKPPAIWANRPITQRIMRRIPINASISGSSLSRAEVSFLGLYLVVLQNDYDVGLII